MKIFNQIHSTAALALLTTTSCSAFITPAPHSRWGLSRTHKTGSAVLNLGRDDSSSSEGDKARERFRARTCVKHFLTQRSVQSFMFLLGEIHDPHTVAWIEEFTGLHNLLEFHGTGAFNISRFESWDSFLMDLMEEPEDEIIIETVRRRQSASNYGKMNLLRQQGKLQENENMTENNPHIVEEIVEYVIDIDPPSLVSRMISVREQLSKEWVEDLDVVFEHNEMILDQYQDWVKGGRDEEKDTDANEDTKEDVVANLTKANTAANSTTSANVANSTATVATTKTKKDKKKKDKKKKAKKEESGIGLADEGCSDLGDYSTEYSTSKKKFFDRDNLHLLTSHHSFRGMASSPIRKGTFDLLILLATQESIHRLLREFQLEGEAKEISYEWLHEFYTDRLEEYFDGNQRYGRADDFLEELLVTSPSMKYAKDGRIGLIDPHGIAEAIILKRGEVLSDFKKTVSKAPADHMNLRKALLDRQMAKLMPSSPSDDKKDEHIEHIEHAEEIIDGGEFQ